jgi:DNA-binding FadR family transcriptional regulator
MQSSAADWQVWAANIPIPEPGGVTSETRHWRHQVARKVLRYLAEHCDPSWGTATPTVSDLSNYYSISRNSVLDALDHLRDCGLLAIVGQRRRVYYLDPAHNPAYLALTATAGVSDEP